MKRVGVTGAAGFIGSHLCDRLLSEGLEVVGVDDLSRGTLEQPRDCLENPRFTFEQFDCTQRRQLRSAFDGCDTIVHLAAQKIPRYGGALNDARVERRRREGRRDGRAGDRRRPPGRVDLRRLRKRARRRSPRTMPLVLGPPTSRRWAYAVSKLYDEHVCLALAEERDLQRHDPALLRLLRPAQPPELVGRPAGGVLRDAARRRHHRHPRRRPADPDVHVHRATRSTASCARMRTPEARGEIVNIGGDRPCTILELAEIVQRTLGHRRSRCGRASCPTSRCPATTRTSVTASRTRPRPGRCSGSRRRSRSRTGLRAPMEWHRARREAGVAAQA